MDAGTAARSTGLLSVLALPVAALRLAARSFVPLALWFGAGAIPRYVLIQAISELGHGSEPGLRRMLVLVLLSVVVLISLVVTIGMMFTLGRRLDVIKDPDEPYAAAIGRTLFPFVLIYLGWNLYTDDLREVLRADAQRLADAGDHLDIGKILNVPIPVALVVAVVAWGLRVLAERRHEARPGRVLAVLVAFLEVNFTLYALYSIVQLVRAAQRWITGRVFWHALTGRLSLPDAGPVEQALVLPLVWLAIAAVVYGLERHDREAIEGTPLERLADRLTGRPRRLAELAGRGAREKYVPVAHAVRLVFRAGAPVFAWFCLCYVAIGALMDRAQRGVIALIGTDHTVRFWNLVLAPVEYGHRLVYEILRLALLAAMFDLVMRRAGGGTPAPDRPAPVTGPGAGAA
ncbi:hypothetical protein OG417_09545 [Actinoallomurus sp. NBC_01490]|uniref:hypothetical protein n=1 Tax=Actinoallomurus sp. NBC_01490 TaxID=2903557 RepID=UPI002E30ED64|nr:hypothetical protein [Actinoallomurus sp. NBC_01490]